MKIFLGLCVIAMAALFVQATDEERAKIREISNACIEKSGADVAQVQLARDGNFPDDDKVAAYFQCMFVKVGFMCADGTLHPDVMLKRTPANVEADKAKEIVDKCTAKQYGDNVEKLAYNLFKCFRTELGYTVNLF